MSSLLFCGYSFTTLSRSVIVLLLIFGCSGAPRIPIQSTNSATPSAQLGEINRLIASVAANSSTPSADYQLGPEDMVQITVYNLAGVDGGLTPKDLSLRVSHQGFIKLPLVGELKVAGLTVSELENLLQDRFRKYIYDPEVGVFVREYRSQRVYLLGAANRAGAIELTGPKTLIDVLALAGGVNQRAGNQVHVYRQAANGRESYVIDLFALANSVGLLNEKTVGMVNMPVQGGDIINIPEAGVFFVDGAVGRPGSFPLGRRYTITQAIALAGGVDRDLADSSNITVYRVVNNEIKQIPVDLNAILAGTEPDLAMQTDDFLYVPISGLKWVWNFYLRQAVNVPGLIPSVPWIAGGS